MTDPRWARLDEVFHQARALDPAERGRFLEEACADDQQLADDVRRLLAADQRAGSFIRDPIAAAGLPEEPDLAGRLLGPYRLVGRIGRGGMGDVYLAERADEQFDRRVAIKLIRRGLATEAMARQFRHERQILATLEHPNVARLLDGGTTDDGLPYFVMEYIEGEPIDRYAEAHGLTLAERIELFLQVATAVTYAHQRLVIHRDIKPLNILVTDAGVPKLLDFGIGKFLDEQADDERLSTVTGWRLLTPEYASPEQVEGRHATTVSDVYSLGVVLYELLTGRSPYQFKSRAPHDIAEAICFTEPIRPSAAVDPGERRVGEWLRRRLTGDLDVIALTALRKEPARRYQSVEQLALDLRRYLDGRPVQARPDTFGYRTAKLLRRNPIAAITTAALALALVAGSATTAWQAHLARQAQARAERRFDDVRALAHAVLFDYHDAIKDLAGATPVRARLVRDGLRYLNGLAIEAGDDPGLRDEIAAAYVRVGDVQGGTLFANLGDTQGAIESYRKAITSLARADSTLPDERNARRTLGDAHVKLGALLWETGDLSSALTQLDRAAALLAPMTAELPDDVDLRYDLHRIYDYTGMILVEQGDPTRALEQYRPDLELLESFPESERRTERHRRALSVSYEHRGSALLQLGKLDEALAENARALAIRQALAAESPTNADYRRTVAVSYYNQGEILARLGRTAEAVDSYRRNLAESESLLAIDPENEQYRGDVAYALIRIGDVESRMGRHLSALASYQRSETIRSGDVRADPTNLWKRSSLIEASAKLCETLARLERREQARDRCEATARTMDSTEVDPGNAAIRGFFADTYSALARGFGRLGRAELSPGPLARRSCAMYRKADGIWDDMTSRGIMAASDQEAADSTRRSFPRCR